MSLVSVAEAARALGVSRTFIYTAASKYSRRLSLREGNQTFP